MKGFKANFAVGKTQYTYGYRSISIMLKTEI